VIAVFVLAAVAVSLAALVERQPSPVVVSLEASELAFTLAEPLVLNEIRFKSIGLAGVGELRADVAKVEQAPVSIGGAPRWVAGPLLGGLRVTPTGDRTALAARLTTESGSADVELEEFPRLRVVGRGANGRSVRLEVLGGRASVRLRVGERADLQCDGCKLASDATAVWQEPAGLLQLTMAKRTVSVRPSESGLVLAIVAGEPTASVALFPEDRPLRVERLEFWRVVEGRAESTLLDDVRVTFEGSKAPPASIRRGELLRLECAGPAGLLMLDTGAKLRARLSCDASVLRVGAEGRAVSLMPSYLSWWSTNERLTVVITAIGSLTGLMLLVLQRLGYLGKAS
jgi:hypothetical protein